MDVVEEFNNYVEVLSSVPQVSTQKSQHAKGTSYIFKTRHKNSLTVKLDLFTKKAQMSEYICLSIDKLWCRYWNTSEQDNLDFLVELATDGLLGKVTFGRSPILLRKEACFHRSEGWVCVPMSPSMKVLTVRRKIRHVQTNEKS